MCPPGTRHPRTIAAIAALGVLLAGCANPGLYLDRRDTIALSGGDAVAANATAQMVDPWPRQSGNTNIAFNGEKMQSAVERYRTNKVIQPVRPTTLDIMSQQQATPAAQTTQAAAPNGNTSSTTTLSSQISAQ